MVLFEKGISKKICVFYFPLYLITKLYYDKKVNKTQVTSGLNFYLQCKTMFTRV